MENNENQEKQEKQILINFMYSGRFLKNNNIGHEIINLFKTDEGENYIYLTYNGKFNCKRDVQLETILLARSINKNTCEILAKATGLEQIAGTNDSNESGNESFQKDYIDGNINNKAVKYGGVHLDRYFKGNPDTTHIHLTFKVENVIKPKKQMYLSCVTQATETEDTHTTQFDNFVLTTVHQLPNQSCRRYFSKEKNNDDYEKLARIINKVDLWEENNKTVTLDDGTSNREEKNSFNFLQIMKKDHDEVVFSNLLAYFFTINKEAFWAFAESVLHIKPFKEKEKEKFEVIRESEENIDLFIKGVSHVIVIENKIKSGINGQDSKGKTYQDQLDKYYEHVNTTYQKESQEKSQEESQKKSKKKYSCHFFILVPNYSQLNYQTSEENGKKIIRKKNESGEIVYEYTLINYSDVYEFFKKDEVKSWYKDEKYFDEFLSALVVHTKTVDNSNEEDMYRRFSAARAAIIKEDKKK